MARKDQKGRNLAPGEGQRKNGVYYYKIRANGRFYTVYSWTLVPTDRTPAGKKPGPSLREKKAQLQESLREGTVNLGRETLQDVLSAYLEMIEARGSIRPATLQSYHGAARAWAGTPLSKMLVRSIDSTDVLSAARLLSDRGLTRNSILLYMVAPRLAIDWLYEKKRVNTRNPFSLSLPSNIGTQIQKKEALAPSELAEVLSALRDTYGPTSNYYLMFEFLALSGLRIGEAIAVTLDDIDWDARILSVRRQISEYGEISEPKTAAGIRSIPITAALEATLRTILAGRNPKKDIPYRGMSGFLFLTNHGGPYAHGSFPTMMWKFSQAHPGLAGGKRLTCHVFRHTCATGMVQTGLSPTTVQYVLGHEHTTTTLNTYVHAQEEVALAEVFAHDSKNS